MSRILQIFCVLFSAGLLALGIPNGLYQLGAPVYGLISLIPLYFVYVNFKSYRQAFLVFFIHALTVHLCSSFWLGFFKDFAVFTLGASAFFTALIAGFAGLFAYLPFARSYSGNELEIYCSPEKAFYIPARIFWFTFVYISYEWVKSSGFIGYPWGTLSSSAYHWKILIQIADITGTYGVSFLFALFSSVLAEGIIFYYKSFKYTNVNTNISGYVLTSLVTGILFTVSFGYGTFRYMNPGKPVKYLNAILVQQNADPWKSNDNVTIAVSQRLTKEKLEEAESQNIPVDLVVWSEGCLRYSWPRAKSHYNYFPSEEPLIPFMQKCHVPFLLGGSYRPEDENNHHYNGALMFDENGQLRGVYGKNHLVPFAEVIPFAENPRVARFLKKVIGISAGWTPGNQYVYFDVPCQKAEEKEKKPSRVISLQKPYYEQQQEENAQPAVRISTPICFDDAFPDVTRPLINYGSELFMNITDDSWSLTKSAEYQHFVISSFRVIETRSSMARSCNSGYSVVLDSTARVIKDLPLFEEAAMLVKIPIYPRTITIYQRLGNWLPHIFVLIILGYAVYTYSIRLKSDLVYSERKSFRKKHRKHHKKSKK